MTHGLLPNPSAAPITHGPQSGCVGLCTGKGEGVGSQRCGALEGIDGCNSAGTKKPSLKSRKITRKCKVCRSAFQPTKPLQSVCGHDCALSLATSKRAKALKVEQVKERRVDAVKRDKLKSRGQWMKEAQTAFNQFIRARDAGLPCICCGKHSAGMVHGGDFDAGHYRSRGSAPHLKYDERNVHAQLKQCNRYDSGNVVGYRMGLIARIGLEALEALEADQEPRRYTIDDLKQIKATYQAKTRAIKEKQA